MECYSIECHWVTNSTKPFTFYLPFQWPSFICYQLKLVSIHISFFSACLLVVATRFCSFLLVYWSLHIYCLRTLRFTRMSKFLNLPSPIKNVWYSFLSGSKQYTSLILSFAIPFHCFFFFFKFNVFFTSLSVITICKKVSSSQFLAIHTDCNRLSCDLI